MKVVGKIVASISHCPSPCLKVAWCMGRKLPAHNFSLRRKRGDWNIGPIWRQVEGLYEGLDLFCLKQFIGRKGCQTESFKGEDLGEHTLLYLSFLSQCSMEQLGEKHISRLLTEEHAFNILAWETEFCLTCLWVLTGHTILKASEKQTSCFLWKNAIIPRILKKCLYEALLIFKCYIYIKYNKNNIRWGEFYKPQNLLVNKMNQTKWCFLTFTMIRRTLMLVADNKSIIYIIISVRPHGYQRHYSCLLINCFG